MLLAASALATLLTFVTILLTNIPSAATIWAYELAPVFDLPFNAGLAVCRVGYTLPSLSSLKAKVVAGFSKLVNDAWPTKRKAAEEEAPGKKEL